jgi:hypothetical protein
MKDFLILFREADGRQQLHTVADNNQHQLKWMSWMDPLVERGNLVGGKPLSLIGKVIHPDGKVEEGISKTGAEFIGGYLLLKSDNLDQAVEVMRGCPVFERGASAEVREVMLSTNS